MAAAGVIVSLIFVGFEIRQSTVAARAEAYQEIGLTIAEFWYNDALNPELMEVTWRAEAGDSLSASELHRARARLNSILRIWETLWLSVDTRALPPEVMQRMACSGWVVGLRCATTRCSKETGARSSETDWARASGTT